MLTSMYKFTNLLIHINRYKHLFNHTNIHTHQYHIWACLHTCPHTFTHWNDHAQKFTHTGGYTYSLSCTCSLIHSLKQIYPNRHGYTYEIHIHSLTHICLYTQIYSNIHSHISMLIHLFMCMCILEFMFTDTYSLTNTNLLKNSLTWGTWVAQSVKHPTPDLSSGLDLGVMSSSPKLELAWSLLQKNSLTYIDTHI